MAEAEEAEHGEVEEQPLGDALSQEEIIAVVNQENAAEAAKGLSYICGVCEQGSEAAQTEQRREILGYLNTSPEASEIFSLWQDAQDGKAGAHLLVQPVLTFLWIVMQLEQFDQRTTVGEKVLKQKATVLKKYIGAQRPRLVSKALRLLGSIARLHPRLARLLCSQINLSFKPLVLAARSVITPAKASKFVKKAVAKKIARRKAEKGQELENARPGFISFLTALLSSSAPDVVRNVVFAKGLVLGLVSGLNNDSEGDALVAVESIASGIARNSRFSRSVRSFVLNQSVLEELVKGFENRSVKVQVALATLLHPLVSGKKLPMEAGTSQDSQPLFKEQAADLPEHQMCIVSPTPVASRGGTAKPPTDAEGQGAEDFKEQDRKSSTAFRILKRLQVAMDSLQQWIAIGILQRFPVLEPEYFAAFPLALEPRYSDRWASTSKFLLRVLSRDWMNAALFHKQVSAMKHGDQAPAWILLASDFAKTVWPQALTKAVFTRGILNSNAMVASSMLSILHSALRRAEKAVSTLRFSIPAEKSEFWKAFRMEMRELVPEIQTLLAVRAKAFNCLTPTRKEVPESKSDSNGSDTSIKSPFSAEEAFMVLAGVFSLFPGYRSLVFGMKRFDVLRLVHGDIQKAHPNASIARAPVPEETSKTSVLAVYPPEVQRPLLQTLRQVLHEVYSAASTSRGAGVKVGGSWLRLPADGVLEEFNSMSLMQSLALLLVSTRSDEVETLSLECIQLLLRILLSSKENNDVAIPNATQALLFPLTAEFKHTLLAIGGPSALSEAVQGFLAKMFDLAKRSTGVTSTILALSSASSPGAAAYYSAAALRLLHTAPLKSSQEALAGVWKQHAERLSDAAGSGGEPSDAAAKALARILRHVGGKHWWNTLPSLELLPRDRVLAAAIKYALTIPATELQQAMPFFSSLCSALRFSLPTFARLIVFRLPQDIGKALEATAGKLAFPRALTTEAARSSKFKLPSPDWLQATNEDVFTLWGSCGVHIFLCDRATILLTRPTTTTQPEALLYLLSGLQYAWTQQGSGETLANLLNAVKELALSISTVEDSPVLELLVEACKWPLQKETAETLLEASKADFLLNMRCVGQILKVFPQSDQRALLSLAWHSALRDPENEGMFSGYCGFLEGAGSSWKLLDEAIALCFGTQAGAKVEEGYTSPMIEHLTGHSLQQFAKIIALLPASSSSLLPRLFTVMKLMLEKPSASQKDSLWPLLRLILSASYADRDSGKGFMDFSPGRGIPHGLTRAIGSQPRHTIEKLSHSLRTTETEAAFLLLRHVVCVTGDHTLLTGENTEVNGGGAEQPTKRRKVEQKKGCAGASSTDPLHLSAASVIVGKKRCSKSEFKSLLSSLWTLESRGNSPLDSVLAKERITSTMIIILQYLASSSSKSVKHVKKELKKTKLDSGNLNEAHFQAYLMLVRYTEQASDGDKDCADLRLGAIVAMLSRIRRCAKSSSIAIAELTRWFFLLNVGLNSPAVVNRLGSLSAATDSEMTDSLLWLQTTGLELCLRLGVGVGLLAIERVLHILQPWKPSSIESQQLREGILQDMRKVGPGNDVVVPKNADDNGADSDDASEEEEEEDGDKSMESDNDIEEEEEKGSISDDDSDEGEDEGSDIEDENADASEEGVHQANGDAKGISSDAGATLDEQDAHLAGSAPSRFTSVLRNSKTGVVSAESTFHHCLRHPAVLRSLIPQHPDVLGLPAFTHTAPQALAFRTSVLRLILRLMLADPSAICCSAVRGVLLAAYSASLSEDDRIIRHMLDILEMEGLSLQWANFMWGGAALKLVDIEGIMGTASMKALRRLAIPKPSSGLGGSWNWLFTSRTPDMRVFIPTPSTLMQSTPSTVTDWSLEAFHAQASRKDDLVAGSATGLSWERVQSTLSFFPIYRHIPAPLQRYDLSTPCESVTMAQWWMEELKSNVAMNSSHPFYPKQRFNDLQTPSSAPSSEAVGALSIVQPLQYVNSGLLADVYDPAYVLPLFAHICLTSKPHMIRFIANGALTLVLSSTLSSEMSIRKLAYGILGQVSTMLEAITPKEMPNIDKIRSLLNLLRTSVTDEFERLPAPIVVFTANAIYALARPNHYMNEAIGEYLKGRKGRGLPKHEVPMVDKRLSTLTPSQTRERGWLLATLSQCLQTTEAHSVCRRKGLYSDVLFLLDTPRLDNNSHRAVLRVIERATAVFSEPKDAQQQALPTGVAFFRQHLSLESWIASRMHSIALSVGDSTFSAALEEVQCCLSAMSGVVYSLAAADAAKQKERPVTVVSSMANGLSAVAQCLQALAQLPAAKRQHSDLLAQGLLPYLCVAAAAREWASRHGSAVHFPYNEFIASLPQLSEGAVRGTAGTVARAFREQLSVAFLQTSTYTPVIAISSMSVQGVCEERDDTKFID